jgi:hypothetical protein
VDNYDKIVPTTTGNKTTSKISFSGVKDDSRKNRMHHPREHAPRAPAGRPFEYPTAFEYPADGLFSHKGLGVTDARSLHLVKTQSPSLVWERLRQIRWVRSTVVTRLVCRPPPPPRICFTLLASRRLRIHSLAGSSHLGNAHAFVLWLRDGVGSGDRSIQTFSGEKNHVEEVCLGTLPDAS